MPRHAQVSVKEQACHDTWKNIQAGGGATITCAEFEYSLHLTPPQVRNCRGNVSTDWISDRAFELNCEALTESLRVWASAALTSAFALVPPQVRHSRGNVATDCISDRTFEIQSGDDAQESLRALETAALTGSAFALVPPQVRNCRENVVTDCISDRAFETVRFPGTRRARSADVLQRRFCRPPTWRGRETSRETQGPRQKVEMSSVGASSALQLLVHTSRLGRSQVCGTAEPLLSISSRKLFGLPPPPCPLPWIPSVSVDKSLACVPPVPPPYSTWPTSPPAPLAIRDGVCWPEAPPPPPKRFRPKGYPSLRRVCQDCRKFVSEQRGLWRRFSVCPHAVPSRCLPMPRTSRGKPPRMTRLALVRRGELPRKMRVRRRLRLCDNFEGAGSCAQGRGRGSQKCPHGSLSGNCRSCHGCPHGKLKEWCVECRPCAHGRVFRSCGECSGCPHGILMRFCRECKPCPHGRRSGHCSECVGCEHGRVRSNCKQCTGCVHGRVRRFCSQCNPCIHGKRKQACKLCSGCPHGRVGNTCAECSGCPHGRVKRFCKVCNGCPHGVLRRFCVVCSDFTWISPTKPCIVIFTNKDEREATFRIEFGKK